MNLKIKKERKEERKKERKKERNLIYLWNVFFYNNSGSELAGMYKEKFSGLTLCTQKYLSLIIPCYWNTTQILLHFNDSLSQGLSHLFPLP
jgi:hypothetical protein